MRSERILIVGAGPTGLTAAVELARYGFSPVLVEKRESVSNLSRAVGILPHSMNVLSPSGVAPAIAEEAIPVAGATLHYESKAFAHISLTRGNGSFDRLFALAQDRTEAHLRAALERYGGTVRYGTELAGLRPEGDRVIADINGVAQEFDYVIGADGVDSTVRQAMGIAFEGYDLPESWSIADVEAKGWPGPECFNAYFIGGGGGVIVVPLEVTRFRVISNRPDALAALPVPMDVTRVRREGTFRISVRQAARYRAGRVFLAGDAAHCHSPVGGRGMNLGIADVADLAARFARRDLDGYHVVRHAEGAKVIRFSEIARRALMGGCGPCRAIVRTGLRAVSVLPALNQALAKRILS